MKIISDSPVVETKAVEIAYRDWKGETLKRHIIPQRFCFAATEGRGEEWLLEAFDMDRKKIQVFDMAGITAWTPLAVRKVTPEPPLTSG